jgi:hypothetical protein
LTQAYPIDIAREIDRRWQRRSSDFSSPQPNNDNHAGDGRCPLCNVPASIAAIASEHRGNGLIHHRWLCHVCGHEWVTALQVSE